MQSGAGFAPAPSVSGGLRRVLGGVTRQDLDRLGIIVDSRRPCRVVVDNVDGHGS